MEQQTKRLISPTALQIYMDCPRQYYFRKIMSIESESREHNDREFGIAIHGGLAHMLLHKAELGDPAIVAQANDIFLAEYRKHFGEDTDELFYPKNPDGALYIFATMASELPKMDIEEVLFVETPGVVPISEDEAMSLRIDAIVRGKRGYYVIDFKTSKTPSKGLEWSMSIQIGLYIHMLYSLYPPDQVWGAMISNIAISATKRDGIDVKHTLFPIRKTPRQMQMWYETTRTWLNQLHNDEERLNFDKQALGAGIMSSFPMNWQSCNKFWGCPFQALCLDTPNPTQLQVDQLVGYKHVEREALEANAIVANKL